MSDDDSKVSPRADFISSFLWMAFGSVVVVLSWNMDRLESQGATLYTMPGLVPGVLGAIMFCLGVTLAVRAARDGGHRLFDTPWRWSSSARAAIPRVALTLLLSLGYAAGMIGHGGIPFWLATFLFVFLFVLMFDWGERRDRNETTKGVVLAFIYGACTAFVVSYVFQNIFLVRLP